MSKFIQVIDAGNYPLIINLEAITQVFKLEDGSLEIYFGQLDGIVLEGQQADIFWELMSDASWQINL